MKLAWAKAGSGKAAPDHLNAHGTGTLVGDAAEAEAIRGAFGTASPGILVSSLKPATGHLLGAAGSVEAVATVLSLAGGFVPPTLNVEEPMPGLPFELVRGTSRKVRLKSALSLSMGFGGHNVALVFQTA
jgi:3-oxoacyl-[acyl-carrier-protein] synthase II